MKSVMTMKHIDNTLRLFLLVLLLFFLAGCGAKDDRSYLPTAKTEPRLELGVKVKSIETGSLLLAVPGNYKGRALLVTKVKYGMLAEKMGIHRDDLIFKINDHRVTGMADSYEVMRNLIDASVLSVELLRGKEIMKLTVELNRSKY